MPLRMIQWIDTYGTQWAENRSYNRTFGINYASRMVEWINRDLPREFKSEFWDEVIWKINKEAVFIMLDEMMSLDKAISVVFDL
jgi:hypothetical protein